MKTLKSALLLSLLLIVSSLANPDSSSRPLELDVIKHITDRAGSLIIKSVMSLQPGSVVCIHLPTGEKFQGKVMRRDESPGNYIKVFGTIEESTDGGFGIGFQADGKVGGAIILRDQHKQFELEWSDTARAFIFMPVNRHADVVL